MKRKNIFNALLIAGLLVATPLAADAAGLGKLKVISALGQPLRAEIDLIAVPKDEVDLLTARIATSEAYKQAKIEQQEGLSAVRFAVEKRPNGEPYLKITSAQAFNEPFLDLLIQLDWPSGRLLREYTILLDPPGFQDVPAAPAVSTPVVRAEPAVKPAPVPEKTVPVESRAENKPEAAAKIHKATPQKKVAEPKAKGKKVTPILKAEPASPSRQLTPAEQTFPRLGAEQLSSPAQAEAVPAARSPVAVTRSEPQEYKVKKGDSLSKIAREMKPEGYSLDQVIVVLYERNKAAFDGNNMNRIKTGQILHAPDKGDLDATKQGTAAKEIKAHAADWNAYRQKLAGTVAEQPAPKEEAKPEATGKITAKAEDKGSKAQEPAKDVLKLSKGETSDKGKGATGKGGGAEARALQDKLAAAQDDAVAKDKALKEANSRISDLDKNVKEMKALLDLKNQQLAELEKQAKAKPVVVPPVAKVEPPKPEPLKPEVKPPVAAVAPAEKPAEPLVKAVPDQPKPEVKPEEKKPVLAAPKPIAKPAPAPEPETSLVDTVMSNPLYLGGSAAAIVGGLFAALWALGRRRKKGLASFEDSIMTGSDLKTNTVFGNTAGGQIDTGDTSFLTDFSQAGMGAIDTNDVDPIAEAEVYMAYGRDAQAEEILKEAMSKDPERHEVQLKLLEIYAGRKNTGAFETLAAELYAATSGQGPVWKKAAEFGRGLDPENPLYASQDADSDMAPPSTAAVIGGGMAAAAAAQNLDFSLDLDTQSPKHDENAVADMDDAMGGALDFDLDTIGGLTPPEETTESVSNAFSAPATEAANDMAAMDFDLDTIIPQAVEKKSEQPSEMADLGLDSLQFNAPSFPEEKAVTPAAAPSLDEDTLALDFDFNLDETSTENSSGSSVMDADTLMPELDLSSIDLNLDNATTQADDFGDTSLDDATTLAGDNSIWEESSTKLDLARAYLEMGDKEGAREILQEVVGEGGPEQQSEANKLLASLA